MTNEAKTLAFPKVKNGTLTDRLKRRANETDNLGDRRLMLDAVERIEGFSVNMIAAMQDANMVIEEVGE